jgi:hypothetical protein
VGGAHLHLLLLKSHMQCSPVSGQVLSGHLLGSPISSHLAVYKDFNFTLFKEVILPLGHSHPGAALLSFHSHLKLEFGQKFARQRSLLVIIAQSPVKGVVTIRNLQTKNSLEVGGHLHLLILLSHKHFSLEVSQTVSIHFSLSKIS